MDNLPRDFKGIWIPKEIWLDQSLSFFEKCLLAEIHSLDGENHCYADNEYFCKFFNVNLRTLQLALAKLKEMNYITTVSFNGRERKLASNIGKTTHEKFDTSGVKKITPQQCNILHGTHIYKKKDKRIDTSISPKRVEREAYGSVVILSKEEYQKAKELCGDALDDLIEEMNDYCEAHSKKYSNYLAAIRVWWKKRTNAPKKKEDRVTSNANWAVKFQAKMGARCKFEAFSKYAEFKGLGNAPSITIAYTENGFKEQVLNQTRKMGLIQFWNDGECDSVD